MNCCMCNRKDETIRHGDVVVIGLVFDGNDGVYQNVKKAWQGFMAHAECVGIPKDRIE